MSDNQAAGDFHRPSGIKLPPVSMKMLAATGLADSFGCPGKVVQSERIHLSGGTTPLCQLKPNPVLLLIPKVVAASGDISSGSTRKSSGRR
mmetsp:Transcript_59909/g.131295  ORF Transcript_59909/g.131295 Transcript_59909/m.131295 type:complete len:91 (-) Transcript_59909:68-340(-)